MRIAVVQYANCFLRFAFFLSIRYSVVSCVGCFIYDSKKTTDLIRINLSFCVLYIGRSNCNVPKINFTYSFKSVYLHHEEGIWKMADGYCQVFNDCGIVIFCI